jgi:hypothetical protein
MDINQVAVALEQKAKLADQYRDQYNTLNAIVKGDLIELKFLLRESQGYFAYWSVLPKKMQDELRSTVKTIAKGYLEDLESEIEFLAHSPILPKPEIVQ